MKPSQDNYVQYQNSLTKINEAAKKDPQGFVLSTEKAYHEDLHHIASRLAGEEPACKLVMLAGPSSSGKTTTAHLLQKALAEEGTGSVIVSLDDFYKGEHNAPLLPNGEHNYECVEALNVEEIQYCLNGLVMGNCCNMPVFDFEIRMPYPHKRHVVLKEHEIAIVEGIHALNPILIQTLPVLQVKKIYISAKQGILRKGEILLDPNEMRLIRRIVRDFNFRGTGPETTLKMWNTVMEGERNYIKPFRKDADFTINSFLAYEPCVLKSQALELLHTVTGDNPQGESARRLLSGLELFVSIDGSLVPKKSILREFIGGGIY